MEITELFEERPCQCCLGSGRMVSLQKVGRLVERLERLHGRQEVMDRLGVAESTYRALKRGARDWQPEHLKALVAMQWIVTGEAGGVD